MNLGSTDLLNWLLTPWSGKEGHHLATGLVWHGRLMVLGWGICIPLGILAARYGKVWPGQDWPRRLDDKHWWHLHRWLNSVGMGLAMGGLLLAWWNAQEQGVMAAIHTACGWALMGLGWAQIGGAMLRGSKGGPTDANASAPAWHGDHYDMTPRRIVFEILHKGGGYLALFSSVLVILLGLATADAPRWMWFVLGTWWLGLGAMATGLQRAGRCIDTYQAIWGPAPALPGATRSPIGLGIRRLRPRNETTDGDGQ